MTAQGEQDASVIVGNILDTKHHSFLIGVVEFFSNMPGANVYTIRELFLLYDAHKRSNWYFMPDQWAHRQVEEALLGITPEWDVNGKPVYDKPEPFKEWVLEDLQPKEFQDAVIQLSGVSDGLIAGIAADNQVIFYARTKKAEQILNNRIPDEYRNRITVRFVGQVKPLGQ